MWRLLLILFASWQVVSAQTWSQHFGGTGSAFGFSVAVNGTGDIFLAGTFSGTITVGGQQLTSAGGSDIVVARFNSGGTLQWAVKFGGTGSETVNSLALDSANNVYIGGGLITGSLARFSSSGALVWTAGPVPVSGQSVSFTSIATDSQGNIVVGGNFKAPFANPLNFGNGITLFSQFTSIDAFLAKYSSNGTCLWAKDFPNSGDTEYGTCVTVDKRNDNILLGGYAFASINLGGGSLTNNVYGAFGFLGKFSPAGTYIWGRRVGINLVGDAMGPFARLQAMAIDGNGDLVVGGDYFPHTNLGGDPQDSGNQIITGTSAFYDHFLAKYSGTNGSYQWNAVMNGIGSAYGYLTSISADSQNNVALTGLINYGTYTYAGTQLVVPYPTADAYMAKFSSTGSGISAQRFNSPNAEGESIAVDASGAAILTGFFATNITIVASQTLSATGPFDIFLARTGGTQQTVTTNWYVDSSKTGTSNNSGTSPANAFTNWVPLGGLDGQWTGLVKGGDTVWVFPGVGYIGNRPGVDAINMYNISGLPNAPITFKAIQSSGLVTTPQLLVSGSFFTFDGRKSDTYTNLINFDNLANLYQITNNINWWVRGPRGFGSNSMNGIYMPNAGYRAKFQWLHVDPYTYNTNNYPFGNNENGVGANTHGVNILQNTGEHIDGGEIAYCYIEEADQCGIAILNNNAPTWGGFRIHHNVITKQGDAGARLAGGIEMDHNIIGHPWTIHGHPNGVVMSPNYSYFHHNIVFDTLDTMMYTPGGGSPMIAGIKIYNNLFYTDKTWSFIYTNEFSSNLPFVNHSVGGLQLLVEANANNFEPWLPQIWTNIYLANNTFICGLGGVATNGNGGINSAVSLPNRYAPGNSLSVDPGLDRGFIYLTNMFAGNNLIYNVSPAGSGQTLGGFQGWVDRFSKDQTTWTNPAITSTAGILFDNANVNGLNFGSTNLFLDYNVLTADQAASKVFAYNGPFSTNFTFATAEAFNTAYTTNGYIHNSSSVPSLVDTNYYDFHPKVSDTVLVGKGTNVTPWASANGGLPQVNMDLSGQTRSTWSVGAYEPQTDLVLHLTFEDMFPATGSVAFATSPFTSDITGYGGTMGYYGFVSTPTNWPAQVIATNTFGPGYKYAAEFVSNTNQIPAYGNFPICQFGAITNIGALSNLSAITISVWMKYFSSQGDTRDNSSTIIDTCEGSPGTGATWSLGRNSAYQTSFSLFTNLDYNTSGDLHANYPDNESTDWHHYAATFNTANKIMNIYLDGTNCGSRDLTGYSTALTNLIVGVPSSGGSYAGKNGWIAIGCRTHVGSPNLADGDLFPNNGWMDGQVEDLRVYNRALAAGEVLAIYNSAVPSPGQGIVVLPKDPVITLNPLSQTITAPATATFTSTATSTNSLTYQWFKNGSLIAGATQTTFTTPTTTTADNGSTYFMVATAGGRTAQSSTAILTVGAPLPQDPIITLSPVGQTVTAPATATFTSTASSTQSLTFQWSKNGTPIAGATQTTYTTPPTATSDNGSTFFMVATAGGRTVQSGTAVLTVNAPGPQDPRITLNPVNQSVTAPATATFTSTATSTQSLTFQWSKNGTPIAGATLTTFTTPATSTGDNGSTYFMTATAGGRSVQSATATLTVNAPGPQDPLITLNPLDQSVITPATATFTSSATSTQSLTFQWFRSGVAISGATHTSFTTPATTSVDNGSTYFMVATAGGRTAQSTTATLTVGTPGPQDPLITLSPVSQSVTAPATATFTATATSTNALTYQWSKNGTVIALATNTSYTTPPTSTSDNGSTYFMVATSGGRTDQSATATLTVFPQGPQDPIITLNPLSQFVIAPALATFTSTASSTNSLAYQWYKNGSAVAGATSTTYSTATAITDNGSTWFMIATAGGRSVQTSTAILSVTPSTGLVAKATNLKVNVAQTGP